MLKAMLNHKARVGLALSSLLALSLFGCGGDGSSSSASSSNTAALRMTMEWPELSRMVPNAANSVEAIVKVKGKEIARSLFTRPSVRSVDVSGGTTTILLQNLPAGEATVTLAAYPNEDGTGVAQATGSSTEILRKGEITEDHATMASTVATLSITPNPLSIAQDGTANLTVEARDASNAVVLLDTRYREAIIWSSDATNVATVYDEGFVTGVAAGSANVTASLVVDDAGSVKTATAPVTVTASVRSLQSIAVTPDLSFMYPGLTRQFAATATYSDHTTADVTSAVVWSSSNPAIATVTAGGLVEGIAYNGSSTITATLEGTSGSATVSTFD